MATSDEAQQALYEAIKVCAEAATAGQTDGESPRRQAGSTAESLASAARQFAEARAWLVTAQQPH